MRIKVWLAVTTLALGVLVIAIPSSQSACAAGPWYVAPGGSDGNACTSPGAPCATINGAIAKASSDDTIYVATGTYTGTGNEVVLLNKSITLSGGWDGTFAAQSGTSTIDGEGSCRGITVNSGVTAIVERFTVQNGSLDSASYGGIWNKGTLTLSNSVITDNNANSGGGVGNDGTLTLNGSVVSNNTAENLGGGIFNCCSTSIVVTLNNSTISGNTASNGGGGIFIDSGTLTLNNSTVSGNTVSGDHGDSRKGGGILNGIGPLALNNSTVSGNMAADGGGGIANYSGVVILQNTILAGNTTFGVGPDCDGPIGSSGYNLIGDTSGCTFSPGTGDLTDVDANLGQLIPVSGAPRYHPLLFGSPAIDAGDPVGCTDRLGNPLLTDQRGAARVGRCDIGAYEYTTPGPAASIAAVGGTPQSTAPFSTFAIPFQVLVLDNIGTPVNNATVAFSAPASGASGTFADGGTYTTTAVTNENGIVTAPAFTANGLRGSYAITATVGDVVTPAHFSLSNFGWYVSVGGDDSNDCQAVTTPCATINGVLGKADFVSGDTVLVATGTYTGTGSEVVLLDRSVRVLGGWDNTFTSQNGTSTIDGENGRRGITVNSGATAIVEHFTVQNGSTGGILNHGILTLNNSTISGNNAGSDAGGGIFNEGTLTVNNSTISGNRTGSYAGGGIFNKGTLIVSKSTISGNSAIWGQGIYNAGVAFMNNSTVSCNMGVGIDNHGTLIVNNSTVSDNTAVGISTSGTVTLQNSVLAGNTTSGNGSDCDGTIGSSGYNLIRDLTGCTFASTTGDLTDLDARLGPLMGSPGYHPLFSGSPAIDAGNPAGCIDHLGDPLTTDQRGTLRPLDGDSDSIAVCDIGAYEFDLVNQVFLPIVLRNY